MAQCTKLRGLFAPAPVWRLINDVFSLINLMQPDFLSTGFGWMPEIAYLIGAISMMTTCLNKTSDAVILIAGSGVPLHNDEDFRPAV